MKYVETLTEVGKNYVLELFPNYKVENAHLIPPFKVKNRLLLLFEVKDVDNSNELRVTPLYLNFPNYPNSSILKGIVKEIEMCPLLYYNTEVSRKYFQGCLDYFFIYENLDDFRRFTVKLIRIILQKGYIYVNKDKSKSIYVYTCVVYPDASSKLSFTTTEDVYKFLVEYKNEVHIKFTAIVNTLVKNTTINNEVIEVHIPYIHVLTPLEKPLVNLLSKAFSNALKPLLLKVKFNIRDTKLGSTKDFSSFLALKHLLNI